MAVWSLTLNNMQRMIETTVRTVRSQRAEITGEERFVVRNCINEALVDFTLDRGIDVPKTSMIDTTATIIAEQNFVDLTAGVIQVVDGTVRIIAEGQVLSYFSGGLSDFYRSDPRENFTASFPTAYAIDTNESGAIRLRLRPTPSQTNTIDLKVEMMVDEDDVSDFPGWYHGALRSLATAIVLEALSLPGAAIHQGRYEDRYRNIREKQRGRSGPQHLQVRRGGASARHPQSRATF